MKAKKPKPKPKFVPWSELSPEANQFAEDGSTWADYYLLANIFSVPGTK